MKRTAALFLMGFLAVVMGCSGDSPAPSPAPVSPPTVGETPTPAAPSPTADPLVGSYRVALMIGSNCSAVPEAERRFDYTASIEHRISSEYVVTLGNGRFLDGLICKSGSERIAGLGCNQFLASQDGGTLMFDLINDNDMAHGGHIVTQTANGHWLEIIGQANASANANAFVASGKASVWYCPSAAAYPFPCQAPVGCDEASLKMEFTTMR